ncbi:DMT family transporter [Herbiconiux sp. CPCC 205716]|uniref:DMT family transporter n=1 Tax=Herbiconiux gentiana TaxID=2970912 RepID=A0ABT2GG54_9MICO|nr:DMT family transporter [Herbiconiux gentiana]MCS5715218.1 DMT family transporter [Herbiconiux gentiana]
MLPALAVLLAAVCFGTTGTAQAFAPTGADPLSIGAARILVGGALLALIAAGSRMRGSTRAARQTTVAQHPTPQHPTPRHPTPRHALPRWALVLIGAAGVLAYQPAFFAGTSGNGVAVGTVVALGSAPVVTGLLAWPLTRRAPGLRWGLATLVALAGVVLISGVLAPGAQGGAPGAEGGASVISLPGLAASLGAGVSYAVYTLASKALLDRGMTASGTMGAVFGVAAAASLPLLLATDWSWLLTPAGLAAALWLGVVTTAVAYVLFGWGLARLPAATVATLTLAEPLTAALLGTLLLGEVLAPVAAVGLAVLAAGILLLTLPAGRAVRPTAGAAAASR